MARVAEAATRTAAEALWLPAHKRTHLVRYSADDRALKKSRNQRREDACSRQCYCVAIDVLVTGDIACHRQHRPSHRCWNTLMPKWRYIACRLRFLKSKRPPWKKDKQVRDCPSVFLRLTPSVSGKLLAELSVAIWLARIPNARANFAGLQWRERWAATDF